MAGRYRGVTKRGSGWQISFTLPNGERRREVVRFPHTRRGEDQANTLRNIVLSEIDAGTLDYASRFPRSRYAKSCHQRAGTMSELLRRWFRAKERHLSRSTAKRYGSAIEAHLIPAFGHLGVSELTPAHIRDWMFIVGGTPKTITNALTPLRGALDQAHQDGLISRNPAERVKNPPNPRAEPSPLSPSEVDRILLALRQRSAEAANYFEFAMETGLRTGELIALEWTDVDLNSSSAFVSRNRVLGQVKEPKTRSGTRSIRLTSRAVEVLKDQALIRPPEGEVFRDPRSGQPWKSDQAPRKCFWYPAIRASGIDRRVPYQTRHTFASKQLSRGANPLLIASHMGHADWGEIRRVYGRWIAESDAIDYLK